MVHLHNENAPYRHDVPIKNSFFDNDDVLYKAPQDQDAYHKVAAIKAVQNEYPDMADKQLSRLMEKGREAGKGSLDIFVERFNIDADLLRTNHYKQLIKLTKEFPKFFADPETPYGNLGKMRIAGVNTHIITHGNPEWTEYTMKKGERNISDFFSHQSQSYTCKDHTPDLSGKTKKNIYDLALNKMGIPDSQNGRGQGCAMVEDTMKNLQPAKELGMMTVLINRKEIDINDVADYVDVVVSDCNEAIHAIMQSNALHEAKPQHDPDELEAPS